MADGRAPASRQDAMPRRVRQSGHDPMTDAKKPLPVYFKPIKLENIRCFGGRQTLSLSNKAGRPAPWNLILSDNGIGKTTLLRCLDVVHRQVVPVHPQPADGRPRPQSGVRPVPVVHVNPRRKVGGSLVWRLAGPDAVPLPKGRLDAAFGVKIIKTKEGVVTHEVLTKKWTDWLDCRSVDFDYESKKEIIFVPMLDSDVYEEKWSGDYIFENEWQSFRAEQDRALELTSTWHRQQRPSQGHGENGRYLRK